MYRVIHNGELIEFKNYEQLINWLSTFNRFQNEFYNPVLEFTGNNPNDVKVLCSFPLGGPKIIDVIPRSNRIYNDDWNSIYDKLLIEDVKNWTYDNKVFLEWQAWKKLEKRKQRRYRKLSRWNISEKMFPEFRRGPWPCIHHHFRYCYYRRFATFNERRNTIYDEMKPFNRGSRGKNLPDPWWDEKVRDWRNKGWKSQGKNRHQWEADVKRKAKKRYGKGLFVCKKFEIVEDVELEIRQSED